MSPLTAFVDLRHRVEHPHEPILGCGGPHEPGAVILKYAIEHTAVPVSWRLGRVHAAGRCRADRTAIAERMGYRTQDALVLWSICRCSPEDLIGDCCLWISGRHGVSPATTPRPVFDKPPYRTTRERVSLIAHWPVENSRWVPSLATGDHPIA